METISNKTEKKKVVLKGGRTSASEVHAIQRSPNEETERPPETLWTIWSMHQVEREELGETFSLGTHDRQPH